MLQLDVQKSTNFLYAFSNTILGERNHRKVVIFRTYGNDFLDMLQNTLPNVYKTCLIAPCLASCLNTNIFFTLAERNIISSEGKYNLGNRTCATVSSFVYKKVW